MWQRNIVFIAAFFLLIGTLVGGGIVWLSQTRSTSDITTPLPAIELPDGDTPSTSTATPEPTTSLATFTPEPSSSNTPAAASPSITPTPESTSNPELLSLAEALALGVVHGEIRYRDHVHPFRNLILTLRRVGGTKLIITVPPGTLLLNDSADGPNLVANKIYEIPEEGEVSQPITVITFSEDEWYEFLIEAYSLNFQEEDVTPGATFTAIDPLPSEVLLILNAGYETDDITPESTQFAIWSITDGIDIGDLQAKDFDFDLEEVEALFLKAQLDPIRKRLFDNTELRSVEGYLTRANNYYEWGEYRQAIADYSEIVSLDSEYAEAYYWRGFAYVQLQDFVEALGDFNEVIDLQPDNPIGYFAAGMVHSSQPIPDYEQAIHNLTRAIDLNEDFVDAYHARGLAHTATGDYEAAINDFTQAVTLDPEFVDGYYARGTAYVRLQAMTEAIMDFSQAIDLNQAFSEAFRARGLAYSELNESDNAVQDLQMYLTLNLNAADMEEIETLISALQGQLPTPAPGEIVSLVDAVNQGWVEAEVTSLGVTSGDSIRLTIQRIINQDMVIIVPMGAVLRSHSSTETDMVVYRLRGRAVSEVAFEPAEVIALADSQLQTYIIEAYSLDFYKSDPSPGSTYSIGGYAGNGLRSVLEAVEFVPNAASNILTIQTILWIVTEDVSLTDLEQSNIMPDFPTVQAVLRIAGLDPQCGQLFGGSPCLSPPDS